MDKVELETIEFVNKGDIDFETKKKAINATNLNKMQTNVSNALRQIQDNILFFSKEELLTTYKVLSNLLGNNTKISASEIAVNSKGTTTILDKYLEKNIMVVGINEDYISTSSFTTKIPLEKVINNMGDKLSCYDNGVKIGAGVSKIKVSANIMEITNSAGLCGGTIAKNGTSLADSVSVGFQYIPTSGQLFNSAFPSVVIDVEENDILYLTAYSQDSYSKTIVAYSGRATYLTVEVIE